MKLAPMHFKINLKGFLFSGVLTSPNYPDNYPYNIEKTETIRVDPGLVLSVEFNGFSIEDCDASCGCDHLTITDGDGTTLMEKSCGSFPYIMIGGQTIDSPLPVPIISKSNIINLVFKTSSYNSGPGWNISWSAVTPGELKKWGHLPTLSCCG